MYPENSLCILRGESIELGRSSFKINCNYRVSFDEDKKGCIVFGDWFSIKDFNKYFVLYPPLLIEKLKLLGLIINGNPISYKGFKDRCDVHAYQRGRNPLRIVYIGHPKENLFAFYPMRDTKENCIKESYDMFIDMVNGEIEALDNMDIQWGNCGIPLGYMNVRREVRELLK